MPSHESNSTPSGNAAVAGNAWQIPPAYVAGRVPIPVLLYVAAAIAYATIDSPLALWKPYLHLHPFVIDVWERVETFGNGTGIFVVLLAVWTLDHGRRRCLPRLIVAAFGTGLAANVVKLLIGRVRPNAWVDQFGGLTNQFCEWFPLAMNRGSEQSFPSAHTTSAVGLALGLAALYPRGRRLFLTMAFLVALQRVLFCAHYVSDCLVGAGLAWLIVSALFRVPAIDRLFSKWERPQSAATSRAAMSHAA
jgi:membrane-associated phospholipid phosphatase